MKIFVVDDEKNQRVLLSGYFRDNGYKAEAFVGFHDLKSVIESGNVPNVVISDFRLGEENGFDVLKYIKNLEGDEIYFIMVTAYGSIEDAVNAMKMGAYDYITKPVNLDELLVKIKNIEKTVNLKRDLTSTNKKLDNLLKNDLFIASSPASKKVLSLIKKAAEVNYPVLITGETGVGKEVAAQAIHKLSDRSRAPFIAVNSAALPKELVEAELFGNEKGAYTGSVSRRKGKFEGASGGTLFLDEIGEMSLDVQSKILRAIETNVIVRIGGNKEIKTDTRIIAATNRDVETEVKKGNFREDLYYRLNVIRINIPPLRERQEDIIAIARYIVKKEFPEEYNSIGEKFYLSLLDKEWKGNVRELINYLRRHMIFRGDEQIVEETGFLSLKEVEDKYIKKILNFTNGNINKAASILGVHRNTLSKRIKEIE
ncbi:MAG: response regulator [Proteobacteria bacterium]|nr:response regulator [Pseudomonadota bacterium]